MGMDVVQQLSADQISVRGEHLGAALIGAGHSATVGQLAYLAYLETCREYVLTFTLRLALANQGNKLTYPIWN